MKIYFHSLHFWVRMVSLLCILSLMILTRLRTGYPPVPELLLFSLLSASTVMIMLPIAEENILFSLVFALLELADSVCFAIIGFPGPLFVFVCLLLVLLHQILRLSFRHAVLRTLFKPQAVWYALESHLRLIFSFVLGLLALSSVAASGHPVAVYMLSATLLLTYLLLYYRSLTGRCLLLSRRKEMIVKRMIGRMEDTSSQALAGEDREDIERSRNLFEKITRIMSMRRPYLDPDYTLQDLSDSTYINKTYVSKTINTMSGKNFRQFVNGYRVQYAVELLEDNPRMTVTELAEKSGFNSSVTFSMAFKLNMGECPGEYILKLRAGLVPPLSSRRGQELQSESPSCGQGG